MATIHGIAVNHLRPTQITVGMIEVHEKKTHLAKISDHHHRLKEFLAEHPIPVVTGPNEKYFVIDHHHLGRALWEVEIDGASLEIVADLSDLDLQDFWREMDRQNWVHPYDEQGHKQLYDLIPHHVKLLRDDPYRSLAAYVRYAGGYDKSQKPFAEFIWADYFRPRISVALLNEDFGKAVERAVELAGHAECAQMPGYRHHDERK